MKKILIVIFSLLSFSIHAQSLIQGIWETGEDNTRIEIRQTNGQWLGKIKSSDNNKAEIGKIILKGLKKDDNKWIGELYAAKRKQWYDVEISPKGNALELEISVGFFSKSIEWQNSD
jgi:uncharacterized protein (DUF2147 family)